HGEVTVGLDEPAQPGPRHAGVVDRRLDHDAGAGPGDGDRHHPGPAGRPGPVDGHHGARLAGDPAAARPDPYPGDPRLDLVVERGLTPVEDVDVRRGLGLVRAQRGQDRRRLLTRPRLVRTVDGH